MVAFKKKESLPKKIILRTCKIGFYFVFISVCLPTFWMSQSHFYLIHLIFLLSTIANIIKSTWIREEGKKRLNSIITEEICSTISQKRKKDEPINCNAVWIEIGKSKMKLNRLLNWDYLWMIQLIGCNMRIISIVEYWMDWILVSICFPFQIMVLKH